MSIKAGQNINIVTIKNRQLKMKVIATALLFVFLVSTSVALECFNCQGPADTCTLIRCEGGSSKNYCFTYVSPGEFFIFWKKMCFFIVSL